MVCLLRVGLTASPLEAGGHMDTSQAQEASARWNKGFVAAAKERIEARTTKHFILMVAWGRLGRRWKS